MSRQDIVNLAVAALRDDGEPTKCPRCGGGPGDPGCGKIVHIVMDGYFAEVEKVLAERKAAHED